MDSIILGFNVVLPLMVYMGLGFYFNKINWLSETTISEMNKIAFRVFLSILIFLNSYNVDTDSIFTTSNLKLLTASVSSVLVTVFLAEIICKKFNVSTARKAVITQGTYRSNLALFGITVCEAIYGAGNTGTIGMLMAILIPLFNILAAIIFANANAEGSKLSITAVLKSIATNPLVVASISGLALSFLHFEIPPLPMTILVNLSKLATPLSFILLGASLVFKNMIDDIVPVFLTTFTKLILMPLCVLSIAIAFGVRNVELVALLGCFASPVAVASYTMAKEEDIAPDLAGEIVAATTVSSIFTIFIFITGLSYFSLI